jgi:hypothetical protein
MAVCAFPRAMMYRQAGEAELDRRNHCIKLLYQEGMNRVGTARRLERAT